MSIIRKTVTGSNISEHITDTEWQCSDGTKTILYSTEILSMLEKLCSYIGGTLTINCGYRTTAYNAKIKGATRSQHLKGTAADIVAKKDGKIIPAKYICCLAQTLGFKGIGYISANSTHLDMRESGLYRGDERSGYGNNVSDFYKYFKVSKVEIENLKSNSVVNVVKPIDNTAKHRAEATELVNYCAKSISINDKTMAINELTEYYNGSCWWVIKKLFAYESGKPSITNGTEDIYRRVKSSGITVNDMNSFNDELLRVGKGSIFWIIKKRLDYLGC